MAYNQYPREIPHPNGFRTVTVFDIAEEKAVRADFQKFIAEQTKAAAKAAAETRSVAV